MNNFIQMFFIFVTKLISRLFFLNTEKTVLIFINNFY